MKKIILFASALISSSIGLIGQTSSLLVTEHVGSAYVPIVNGAAINRTVTAGGSDGVGGVGIELNFKNISSATKSYKFQRFDELVNTVVAGTDEASASFCFETSCFPGGVMLSPTAVVLNANEDAESKAMITSVHFEEASVAGYSRIRYRLFETSAPSTDYFEFTVHYNKTLSSIKTNSSLLSFVSSVFPNPCSAKASINVNALSEVNNASVTITNALGAVVSTKNIDLTIGKNTIDLDSQNLSDGLYFVTIGNNGSKITKKFTVSK